MIYSYRHNPRKSKMIEKKILNNAQVTSMKKNMVNELPVCLAHITQINHNNMSLSKKYIS
jgi:hypothetical protein